jgi:hypothetical protein
MAKSKQKNSRPNVTTQVADMPKQTEQTAESKQEKMIAKQVARSTKFRKNAPRAMTQALRGLTKVDALTNNRRYSWEPKHAQQMIAALEKAVNAIKVKFENPGGKSGGFEFTE